MLLSRTIVRLILLRGMETSFLIKYVSVRSYFISFSTTLTTNTTQYDLTKFSSQNATSIDHTDPSINCVLTAKSHDPETPLADFLWFGPRWDVASNTFRLPYFHRNSATEFLASLYGNGLGRSGDFLPGGGSVEVSHTPHGNFSEEYVFEMREQVNDPRRILESMSPQHPLCLPICSVA